MQQMNRMCKTFLAGTAYVVSNSLRKRSIQINLKYEERVEVMRRLALRLFDHKMNTHLTPSEVRNYVEFSRTIFNVKLTKLKDGVRKLDESLSQVEGWDASRNGRYKI